MRVLLDANLLVSGAPASVGEPAEIISRWQSGQFQLVVSEPLLAEVERVGQILLAGALRAGSG